MCLITTILQTITISRSLFDALSHGEIYPGWLSTPNLGYGDVVVRFYPPALYYLLAAGRALAGNWYAATLIVIATLSALGSLGAYFWARCFVPRNVAVWAGVFYALMPYHLSEFYQAAQLAEFAAGASCSSRSLLQSESPTKVDGATSPASLRLMPDLF